ncbi:FliO/MopB family protein [Leptospira sp. GIMC2001]|uniref:FliO/MopB family protein n=1 Tax=Leptospira sp. GIMC2001 TaxID=1513297 RepID=UPI0023491F12|nr:flagellar biosynthetic protein FliO [Leptospira sp. GIMC2001]WCL48274.1 flagellar biosynthetic protein FliO [Leptospira sp. GIMC2001]
MVRWTFALIFLATSFSAVYSQEKRTDLDMLLQKELGLETNKNSKESSDKENPESKKSESGSEAIEESNPIQDRYGKEEEGASTLWLLVKVIFVFGGLTTVMMYVLKVMSKTRNSRFPVKDVMNVLSSVALAPNKQIQIVEVADRLLVLGVGDQSVNFLTEITSIDEKNRILKLKEEFQPSQENFLVTLLESFKELTPRMKKQETDLQFGEDEELKELEIRHKQTLERLKLRNKELGIDLGGKA